MNKNHYKVIFSHYLQQMTVVPETARSGVGGASNTSYTQTSTGSNSHAMRRVVVNILLALGLASLSMDAAQANGIVADNKAPQSQRPVVLTTGSGVPLIHIRTPNSRGVSMNQYQQFDIGGKGAVLANNRKSTQAHIAGWVAANPYMARGAADVIVNQINSNRASHINGYIEVAGKRADVIIANPSGLHINGGGFLNAGKAILSTGRVRFNQGAVVGHSIEQGHIQVGKKGLDLRDSNYAALLARSAAIHGAIHKGKGSLDVITGNNHVNSQSQVAPKQRTASSNTLNYAIDTSKLGGMYAQSIRLISTEKGLGVNNNGYIQAGTLSIQADGTLRNSGIASGRYNTNINSQAVKNQGIISNVGSTHIHTKQLNNQGDIDGRRLAIQTDTMHNSGNLLQTGSQALTLSASNLHNTQTGKLGSDKQPSAAVTTVGTRNQHTGSNTGTPTGANANGFINVQHGISNSGTIAGNAQLNLKIANQLNNAGAIRSHILDLSAAHIQNSGSINSTQQLTAKASSTHNSGTINAKDSSWISQQSFTNQGTIAAENLYLESPNTDNRQGRIAVKQQLGIKAANKLNNQNGTIGGGQWVQIQTDHFNNQQGKLLSQKNLQLKSANIDNRQGRITAEQHLDITATNNFNNQQGKLLSKKNLQLKSPNIDNRQGRITAKQHLGIKADNKLNNQIGTIGGGQWVQIQTDDFNNQQGKLLSQKNLQLNSRQTHNQQGKVQAQNRLHVKTEQLNNQQGAIKGKHAKIDAQRINNIAGTIVADASMALNIQNQLNNRNGRIISAGLIGIRSPNSTNQLVISNLSGVIQAKNLGIKAKSLTGDGDIQTVENLGIQLKDSFTASSRIVAGHNLQIKTQGDLSNNSHIVAGKGIQLQAHNVYNNINASIVSKNQLKIDAQRLKNEGLINSFGLTHLNINKHIDNIGKGQIYGTHTAIATEQLNNQAKTYANNQTKAAVIGARQRLDIGAKRIYNEKESELLSMGSLHIGGKLNTQQQAQGQARLVDNYGGKIISQGDMHLAATTLKNHNSNLQVEKYIANTEKVIEVAIHGRSQRYDASGVCSAGGNRCFSYDRKNQKYATLKGTNLRAEHWDVWDYTKTQYKNRVKTSTPGQIIVGGDLIAQGANWLNHDSKIIIGGDFTPDSALNLTNSSSEYKEYTDIFGRYLLSTHEKGWYDWKRRPRRKEKNHATYTNRGSSPNAPVIEAMVPIGITRFERNTNQQPNSNHFGAIRRTKQPNANGQHTFHSTLVRLNLTVPTSSLFSLNNHPNILIQTDSNFLPPNSELSAPYNPADAANNPYYKADLHKRIGDGYYEQRLIREQIAQLTGRRFTQGFSDDLEQYKALINRGAVFAKKYQLQPGVALTAAQMQNLTEDLVILETQTITLADGSRQTVLAPKVYLATKSSQATAPQTALTEGVFSARNLNISGQNYHNSATAIADTIRINSAQQSNRGVQSANHIIQTGKHISHSGHSYATDSITMVADQLDIQGATSSNRQGQQQVDRQTVIQAGTNANGSRLNLIGDNINIQAAHISNRSQNGKTNLVANQNLTIGSLSHNSQERLNHDSRNYRNEQRQTQIGSHIQTQGDLALQAGKQLNIQQSHISSQQGALNAQAQDINIQAGHSTSTVDASIHHTGSGFLYKSSLSNQSGEQASQAHASELGGKTVNLNAQNNLNIEGSYVISDTGTRLTAGNNIDIQSSTNQSSHYNDQQEKESGLMGTGGIGIFIGTKKTTADRDNRSRQHNASTVGSLTGDTTIIAGNNYKQTASNVLAPKGNVNILAKNIDVEAGYNSISQDAYHTYKQSGLTVAVNVPVINAIQGAISAVQNVNKSKSSRVNAMALANAGKSLVDGYGAIKGTVAGLKDAQNLGDVKDTMGISVSISLGSQKNSSESHLRSNSAQASSIQAGGKANLIATGSDTSSINVTGSDIAGQSGTNLLAEHNINLQAAQETSSERSNNKSSGGSIGVSIGSNSIGVTVSANKGKGHGTGNSTSHRNSHVGSSSGDTTISTGDKLTLKGAQVQGKGVGIQANNLHIESLQDTANYNSKQTNIGGSLSFGIGAPISGSINMSKSKAHANHRIAQEQSGIYAGDNGYQIDLAGNAKLIGGAIISSADPTKNRLTAADFSYSDLANHSHASATSQGFGGGFSFNRDQTSEQDRTLNETYRNETYRNKTNRSKRTGETFTQANPNQAKASPLQFGLTENDVHSTDQYALLKLLGGNLLNNDSQSHHSSNRTQSVISAGQHHIGSTAGQHNIQRISKASNTNYTPLQAADPKALLKEAQHNQAVKGAIIQNVAQYTDAAYRSQFIAEHRMMGFVMDENGEPKEDPKIIAAMRREARKEGITDEAGFKGYVKEQQALGHNIYQLYELSDQQRAQLKQAEYFDPVTQKKNKAVVVAFNGIFNGIQAAARYAVQNYVADRNPQTGALDKKVYKNIYFVHNPKTGNFISELMVAGYQKMLEGTLGGLGNSTIQAKNLLKQHGKTGLYIGSHSRGTLTVANALRELDTQANRDQGTLSNTNMKMVGAAANVAKADNRLSGLQQRTNANQGIQIEGHKRDFIAGFPIGNNPSTTATNTKNKGGIRTTYEIFNGKSSVHSCYGLGIDRCIKDGYRTNTTMPEPILIHELNKDNTNRH